MEKYPNGEDDTDTESPPRPGEEDAAPEPQGGEQDESRTILISKDAWPDAKPGQTKVVRAVRVHDQDIEAEVEDHEEAPPERGPKGNAGPIEAPVGAGGSPGGLYE